MMAMRIDEVKDKRIAVLLGGLSAERDVSLRTGRAVLNSLLNEGYQAIAIDAGRDLAARLREERIEVAFIALHGRFGEDGTVQGLLEMMGIPYTGSGVLASSLAMDKVMTKKVLLYHGLPTPVFEVVNGSGDMQQFLARERSYPRVVKPSREGSTIGVSIVRSQAELATALTVANKYDDSILVEEYIAGQEVTVGVLNGKALPVIQVVPKGGFYDYQSKYTAGQTEYLLPAPIPADIYSRVQEASVAACLALGCRGAARVDFMIRGTEIFCLEVNTIPGMTETSLLPKAAGKAGMSFTQLVLEILQDAGLGK